jgi:hypothetical protein
LDTGGRSKQSRAPNKKKRGSSQALDGHSSKKSKVGDDEEKPPKEKPPKEEPQKIHPVLQNGLYAAELFAAHIVRQSVITYVVEGKLMKFYRCLVKLIARTRRHDLPVVF